MQTLETRVFRVVSSNTQERRDTLKVVCWNIERGYLLPEIIVELQKLDADILLLQEVDVNNKRTFEKDVGAEIAKGLNLPYLLYGVEFFEIESPGRLKLLQGGGSHGNCIISRYPISSGKLISLPRKCNWERSSSQPRKGDRMAIVGIVETEQFGDVACVSVHLENFCGPIERREQFKYLISELDQLGLPERRIVAGDMNTIVTGLSFFYGINLFSLADIWERIKCLITPEAVRWYSELKGILGGPNDFGKYKDSYDAKKDYTVSQVFGLYRPKLDWILHAHLPNPVNIQTGTKIEGPILTRLSDHAWLFNEFPVE